MSTVSTNAQAAVVLAKLPGGFIRDCQECDVDVGEYNPSLRSYASDSLDQAPAWMKPAARALLRAIAKAEESL